jgi:hydroxymethylbilane synthase
MKKIRLTGRSSRLSLLQIERVKCQILSIFPELEVEVFARESRGDILQDIPLHTVEGTDFFTADLYRGLAAGEADIAVHSLKDMSAEHFFGENFFAVVDRDDTRDVAIFNANVTGKIIAGETLVVGTCSPRREEMAVDFLSKALPSLKGTVSIEVKPIRGNVETRLRKLDAGEYDGTILATAGLNRLLSDNENRIIINKLLDGKKIMILPLIECVPAPCQGAIVAECLPGNNDAVEILRAINKSEIMADCFREKKAASVYGTGCIQKFGVTSLNLGNAKFGYAAGRDQQEKLINHWTGLPDINVQSNSIFSSTDHMADFFTYDQTTENPGINTPIAFIANYKAIQNIECVELVKEKRVWASGTKTWYELARKGIWVEGCADALGLESLLPVFKMPLLNILQTDVTIVTHSAAALHWKRKGWNAAATYSLKAKHNESLKDAIKQAGFIFWTSFGQYELYSSVVKADTVHASPYGETSERLKQSGIEPIIFPTIKSFNIWRSFVTP